MKRTGARRICKASRFKGCFIWGPQESEYGARVFHTDAHGLTLNFKCCTLDAFAAGSSLGWRAPPFLAHAASNYGAFRVVGQGLEFRVYGAQRHSSTEIQHHEESSAQ